MTALVSVPWHLTNRVGAILSRGLAIRAHECPEIDRVYFAVPVDERFGQCSFLGLADIEVSYFETERGAMAWGERDAERRLEEM